MKRLFVPVFTALLLVAACQKSATTASISIETSATTIPVEGGSCSVTVNWINCHWRFREEGTSFLSNIFPLYSGAAGESGSTNVSFDISANTSDSAREIILSVKADDGSDAAAQISLTQAGKVEVLPDPASVKLDASQKFQTIDGWGCMNGWGVSDAFTDAEADILFGSLGLNIMRVRIDPDKDRWPAIAANCKYAYDKYGVKILASPWSMPAYMKDNGSLNGNTNGVQSHLLPEYYEEYALYLEEFAASMASAGVPLHAISVQNEPDWPADYEGCLWTADNHKDFLAQYGDIVKSALLVSGESLKTNHSFYEPALKDQAACAALDIVGGHLYGASPASFSLVAEKGKRLWMTEHLLNESWDKGTSIWDETMEMAREMHLCMVNGWNAYIWWYGRRYYSLIGDGEKNTLKGTVLPRGQVFGHYSRFVKPGDTRIGATVSGDILASAFTGDDGHLAVVVINPDERGISPVEVDLGVPAGSAKACISAESSQNQPATFNADGNKIIFDTLPGKSIVTILR